jgi:SpoVK/Ycf46/Vps4 family AAA+-type ATPase
VLSFSSLWDGLATGDSRVLILGATNRPNDIDKAILRRMPKRFPIKVPDADQRLRILSLLLSGVALDSKKFNMSQLVNATEGFSGSDLKELCRNAAMTPVREALRELNLKGNVGDVDPDSVKVRPLRLTDFIAVEDSKESGKVQGSDGTLSSLDLD